MSAKRLCIAAAVAGLMAAQVLFAAAGKKCLFLGNSLTDEVYATQDIAEAAGYTNCTWGRHTTPGTPLWLLWRDQEMKDMLYYVNNSQEGVGVLGPLADILSDTAWDAVVLQVYPMNGDGLTSSGISTVDAARGFAAAAYQGNPSCQVYIYESHPVYADFPTPNASSNNPPYMTNDTTIYRPLADSLRRYFPANPPALVIPTNPAWHRLRLLAEAGNAPGLSSYRDLYAADAGHSNANGRYLLATLLYATIYRVDPQGVMTSGFKHLGWDNGVAYSVTTTFGQTVQDVVWETLMSYSYDGVNDQVAVDRPTRATVATMSSRASTPAANRFDLTGRRCGAAALPLSVVISSGRPTVSGELLRSDRGTVTAR